MDTFSQTDSSKILVKPVTSFSSLIKYSNAKMVNNLAYDGTANGFINGNKIFIKNFESLDTFSFETNNFDSIQFYYDLPNSYVDKFFLTVADNEPFNFTVIPIREISNFNMTVDNSDLKNLVGQKLYDVKLSDDVDANRILVTPNDSSSMFIDVWKTDSIDVTYQIRLKNKDEFVRNLTQDIKKKWSKGDEVSFPISIRLTDKNVPSDSRTYTLILKKKKKPKKNKS
ncbi:MAG: hypothetical protein ABI462_04220 [Ignavibacteria bacterium]